jgi:hypothetical protein
MDAINFYWLTKDYPETRHQVAWRSVFLFSPLLMFGFLNSLPVLRAPELR